MPAVLPNTTTTDNYPPPGRGGAQVGIGDVFYSGYFIVANAAVICEYYQGVGGQAYPSDEMYLTPGTYPMTATDKSPLGGIRFRSAVAGKTAQVFGVFYYKDEATLLAGSEFTSIVSSGGGIKP